MTTRLDRLLLLLDTGSTPSVRLTAARQLGQIAAQTIQHSSPSFVSSTSLAPNVGPSITQSEWRGVDGEWQEIVNLLSRILPYLRSKSWETRQAASEAVDAICKAVGIWDPSPTEILNDAASNPNEKPASSITHDLENQNARRENLLTYQNFKLDNVLSEGIILLASAGKEFDHQSNYLRTGENLIAAQRDVANKLGLGGLGPIDFESMGVDDPVQEQQLKDQPQDSSQVSTPNPHRPQGVTPISIDPRLPPRTYSESHPSITPTSEAAGLSTLGLSQSPRSHVFHQPSHSSYPPADENLTNSAKSTPTMRLPQLPATAPTSEAELSSQTLEGLSARERNALKRKRKAISKGNTGPACSSISSSANAGMSALPSNASEPTQTPKFRIIEQTSMSSDDPHRRVAVPTSPSVHCSGSQVAPHNENQSDNSKAGSRTEPTTSDKVIIDPGAKAQARKAALGHSGSPSGGEINAVTPSHNTNAPLPYKAGEWPFTPFVEILMIDLFSSQWEYRHGAALSLIPLLKIQGSGAAKSVGVTCSRNAEQHQLWMEDIGLRLICLLSLDRFGDYVGDQVIAPVRETAAQAISLVGRYLDPNGVKHMLSIFHQMVEQENVRSHSQRGYAWQVRHAGLLGMKYLVAVKNEMLRVNHKEDPDNSSMKTSIDNPTVKPDPLKVDEHMEDTKPVVSMNPDSTNDIKPTIALEPRSEYLASGERHVSDSESSSDRWSGTQPVTLLSTITSAAFTGLRDQDDDVRAAASGTLLPVTDLIVELLPTRLNELLEVLWDALGSSKDDLSSSVGNIMDLLANLITYPTVLGQLSLALGGHTLPSLIPRLFPFFRHTISSVRLSVVKTIHVFLKMPNLPVREWVDERLLRLTFQNLLVEERPDIRAMSHQVWIAATSGLLDSTQSADLLLSFIQPHLSGWFELMTTPRTRKLNASLFYTATRHAQPTTAQDLNMVYNVDKPIMSQDLSLVSIDDILCGRLSASKAIGCLMSQLTRFNQLDLFTKPLLESMTSEFALPKLFASITLENWAEEYRMTSDELRTANLGQLTAIQPLSNQLRKSSLFAGTKSSHAELDSLLAGTRKDIEGLLATFASLGKVPPEKIPQLPSNPFTIEYASHVVNDDYQTLLPLLGRGNKKTALASLEDRRRKLLHVIGMYERDKVAFDTQLDAAAAAAVVALREIPGKISPVIKGFTQSIKNETVLELQTRSANALASFVDICTSPESPVKNDPTDKIIRNLATYLCQDESQTPTFAKSKGNKVGIFSAEDNGIRPPTKGGSTHRDSPESESASSQAKLLRRGAELALSSLAARFGDSLIDRIPKLWHCMSEPLLTLFSSGDVAQVDSKMENEAVEPKLAQDLLDCLTVLPAVASSLPSSSLPRLVLLFEPLCRAVSSKFAVVRYSVVKCYAELCKFLPEEGMLHFINHVLPLVGDPVNLAHRQGAIEMLSRLVDVLSLKILAYIIFLVVPVLGRMSDPDDDVRHVATHTFACLIKLMPLEAGVPDPTGFPAEMLEKRQSERQFLSQLLGGSKIEEYNIPIKVKADLRKYQRDGISWLAFLAKYQLHGILCDDMGLGKTLQSICILASKHHERAELHALQPSPSTVHLPSLVVCPPTLTGHWAHEIRTYAPNLKPLLYVGGPPERLVLLKKIKKHDVVILSYDIVRNDIERLSKFTWNYCILDEGHIIKNAKSKLSQAVKLLKANHRLILSGTPIQNNALELWSLFDFLMPGFLGTEKYFNERFGRPISASRDAKSSSKEQEAGALALEALHKQVLPFLLRRLKEDVLDDLPPKIIQDYYCELSPIQKRLYEDFSNSQAKVEAESLIKTSQRTKASAQHVFQALQYLKKLVNHPSLVLRPDLPQHQPIISKLGPKGLRDITHAPKLLALRQILRDCGIGLTTSTHLIETVADDGGGTTASGGTIPQHRVLIFCQMKQMLDIIEHDLFKLQMPNVTYMRMDGSTDATKRHDVVQTFNSDPSIDCLLLTTHVGGLGLNLTGADTVIFVEHDWNPMKDLQAMDRAHRLGQKKVVNVYRLITRATLEEKIMGLQRFKMNIATSIVNQQNSNLASLNTNEILDLFNVSSTDTGSSDPGQSDPSNSGHHAGIEGHGTKSKNVLDGLEDLPPESEYDSLDPAKFLSSL
ncbi:TATA-binding protein-associated factor mot1 [Puccinia graminis f. sp. tritici]|uniref:TATA-binding protein-associated factor mot1 n=2 Tax=Puccinia graminis f. sp. tritici TaxID=56615 RepID=A0A5B0PKF6_PUCGR|nr:TATA-binding protein-associated factor mot1 [Puccinia graminis f. sp. tritici]